jgi:hypothetical protein
VIDSRNRPYWHYQDPLEPTLQAQVSSDLLMEHVRPIGAWERESGSPGEAQAYDYLERALKLDEAADVIDDLLRRKEMR